MGSRPAVISGSNYTQGGSVFQGNNINVQGGTFSVTFKGSRAEENETSRCLTAMFITDSNDDRERIINLRGKRTEKTCTWILTTDQYENWQNGYGLLWVSGGPGKGKTMLSIALAEHLGATINQKTSTLLQFYCDSRDERRNTAVAILRGLIFQIVTKFPSLLRHVMPVYNIQKERLFSESSFEPLWRIFSALIHDPEAGEITLIIDGLDECEEKSLELLLRQLQHLFSEDSKQAQQRRMRVVLTSREHDDCCAYLDYFLRIRLEDPQFGNQIEGDLSRFISTSVEHLAREKNYPNALRDSVEDILTKRAKGTFLWVSLAILELKKKSNVEVSTTLESLPAGLDELYCRILLQIRRDRRKTVALILRWVALAVRPLMLVELAALTHVQPGPGQDLQEAMKDRTMFCPNLLAVDGNKVYLAHESVKDFLLSSGTEDAKELELFRISPGQADLEVAEFCIKYIGSSPLTAGPVPLTIQTKDLLDILRVVDGNDAYDPDATQSESESDISLDEEAQDLLKKHPLLAYATAYWTEHVRRAAAHNPQLDFQAIATFCQKSSVRDAWLRTLLANTMDSDDDSMGLNSSSSSSVDPEDNIAERTAAQGFKLLRKVAKSGIGMRARLFVSAFDDDDSETVNSAAPQTGFSAWQSRWERFTLRASFSYRPGQFFGTPESWSALHVAACFGLSPVVEVLLQGPWWKGQLTNPVHQRDGNGLTPMMWATLKGDTKTMALFFAHGADANTKTAMLMTPLHVAAVWSEPATRLLLGRGAGVNVVDCGGSSPLHYACRRVDGKTVALLLEHGAERDSKDNIGRMPLHIAASFSEAATRMLIAAGADVNAVDKDGDMPLDYAIQGAHSLETVSFLLNNGAIVDSSRWSKALWVTAATGNKELGRELLTKGANPNMSRPDWSQDTPLSRALLNQHTGFASMLLRHGADIDFRMGKTQTVLHVVAAQFVSNPKLVWDRNKLEMHDYPALVKFIVRNGADVNCQDVDGDTPLHVSVNVTGAPPEQQWARHQAKIVAILVEAGADVTLQNKNGLTPLDLASQANVAEISAVLSMFTDF